MPFIKLCLFCVLFLVFSCNILAQNRLVIMGDVHTQNDSAVALATVQLISSKGELKAYGITDFSGEIKLLAEPCEGCSIEIRHLNFEDKSIPFSTNKATRFNATLRPKMNLINEVFVEANIIGGRVRQDTIIYNLAALRSGKEEKLKDLLSKLPGVEIEDNGQIKVNGKVVDKLLVNGQDFFEGNAQLATENISAKTVGGVSLLQNYRSNTSFSSLGSNRTKALDITIKEEYLGKTTGELELGGALPTRYWGRISGFRFAKQNSISLVAISNSVGDKGISLPTYANRFAPIDRDMNPNENRNAHEPDLPEFILNQEKVKDNTDHLLFLNYLQQLNAKLQNAGSFLIGSHNFSTFQQERVYLAETRKLLQQTSNNRNSNYTQASINNTLTWNWSSKSLFRYKIAANGMQENEELQINQTENSEILQKKKGTFGNFNHYLSVNYKPNDYQLATLNIVQEISYQPKQLDLNYGVDNENYTDFTLQKLHWKTHQLRTYTSYISRWRSVLLRADAGANYSSEKLFLHGTSTDSILKKSAFAKIGVQKNYGKWQYNLAGKGVAYNFQFQGEKSSHKQIFPQFSAKYLISATHSIEFAGSQSLVNATLQQATKQAYRDNFRWVNNANAIPVLKPFQQSVMQLDYLNLSLYHGYMFFLSAEYQQQEQTIVERTGTTNGMFYRSYSQKNIPNHRLSLHCSGDIRISPLQHKIFVRAFSIHSQSTAETQQNEQEYHLQNIWFRVGWNSYFKKDNFNYELSFAQQYNQSSYNNTEESTFRKNTYQLSLFGKPSKWSYKANGFYTQYFGLNESLSQFRLDIKLQYNFRKAKWSTGIHGQNILQLNQVSALDQNTEAGLLYEDVHMQLPGFVGAFVKWSW